MNELPKGLTDLQDPTDAERALFGCYQRAVSQPIFQTSLFTFRNFADMAAAYAGNPSGPIYARGDNPTVMAFEREICRREGTEAARAFASGMGAISATAMAFLRSGDRIVTINNLYSDAYRLFETLLRPMGIEITYVNGQDTAAVGAALPGARLLFLESPTSLTFELQDLRSLANAAQREGVLTMIDNSWATPVFQRPAQHGIDLVIHAASKFLSGHSDTVAGVVTGRKPLIDRINASTFPYLGGKLSPFEAWLLLRGMQTLDLRMARHQDTGQQLARALSAHPAVTQVLHPMFCEHPGTATLTGHASVFSVLLEPSIDIPRFCDALRVFQLGVSWGGPESLVVPAEAVLHQTYEISAFRQFGLNPRLVRLYAGLEDAEVLLADLEYALQVASR